MSDSDYGHRDAEELYELWTIIQRLNGDERAPLLMLARRIWKGREQYGALDLATDKRDFASELLEELADGVAYSVWAKRKASL